MGSEKRKEKLGWDGRKVTDMHLKEQKGIEYGRREPGLQDGYVAILQGEEQVKVESITLIFYLQNKAVSFTHTHTLTEILLCKWNRKFYTP